MESQSPIFSSRTSQERRRHGLKITMFFVAAGVAAISSSKTLLSQVVGDPVLVTTLPVDVQGLRASVSVYLKLTFILIWGNCERIGFKPSFRSLLSWWSTSHSRQWRLRLECGGGSNPSFHAIIRCLINLMIRSYQNFNEFDPQTNGSDGDRRLCNL